MSGRASIWRWLRLNLGPSGLRERLLARPFEAVALAGLPGPLVGAEVGVFKGRHAAAMFRRRRIKLLYAVDPYAAYPCGFTQAELDAAERSARRRLRRRPVKWVCVEPWRAAHMVPARLDFVYIDANHSYVTVLEDCWRWKCKVRPGGVLGGHDFDQEEVGRAVVDFAASKNLTLRTERKDWWTTV